MECALSPPTHLKGFFDGWKDKCFNSSWRKILLRYINSRREETQRQRCNKHNSKLLLSEFGTIFNIVYLIFKFFFHPTSQNFRFYRYQDTGSLWLRSTVPIKFPAHTKSKQWNAPWPRSRALPAACHHHLLPKGLGRVSRHHQAPGGAEQFQHRFCQA